MKTKVVALLALLICTYGYAAESVKLNSETVYTLYRSSALAGGEKFRVHVATFDATDGTEYNRDNCDVAKALFQTQQGLKVTYWCERGYFSKR